MGRRRQRRWRRFGLHLSGPSRPVRFLLTGAGGQLGLDLADVLSGRVPPGGRPPRHPQPERQVVAADRATLDVADRDAVWAAIDEVRPDVIVHGGAWTAVDACEGDPTRAFTVNALGTRHVARAAAHFGAHVVYVSTDYVFDGTSPRPYVEWDQTNPMSVYGQSKLGGERELDGSATIVRTSWVSGARGANIVRTVARLAAGDATLRFVDDQRGSPTFTADLAQAISVLAAERLSGIFHVTNQGVASWFEVAQATVAGSGHDPARVLPVRTADLDPPRPAPRPANSVLDNLALRASGLELLPDWHDGLERLLGALEG